ncbi:Nucleolar protein 56 [Babesia sp. Xinjiang]|uniref:Nucleolar protein 56 n=1 Tax=Babesia sp. Xinjiang TaxID=462227 RepID=UPI000A2474C8|nr:Nucleolar protein 56 [Babesia sp. Xinjiang]ORM39485.1 Nucleolar protein 56 [Babesia sp. Xinjiang]
MEKTYFLFETAAGYALYLVNQWEQIGHIDAMEEVCCSADRFKEAVQFKAFQPFTTASDALENIRAVVDGEVTAMLSAFLGLNMPKKGAQLAVVDPALGKSLTAKGLKVVYDPNVIELVRGCRQHEMKNIAKLASGASAFDMDKFHVGLGHNFSRSKLQIDPRRHDKPVINCVALLDSLTKNLNSFAMRVREWYGWHFPELVKIVPDNKLYCQVVRIIQCKNKFDWDTRINELKEIIPDDEVIANINKAARQSIGHELTDACMENIFNFTTQVVKLEEMRERLNDHLSNKLMVTAPNLSTLAGNILTGRLISHAGSLVNLAKMSASSIQILGAEKALFRALKTRSNTPKYGLIFQSTFIGKASVKHKGRAARYLANKCALAARLDCFCDVNTDVYGKRMVELLGKRMEYLAGGPPHETSIDVMHAASKEYQAIKAKVATEKRKRSDVQKEHDVASADTKNISEVTMGDAVTAEQPSKKSKKQKKKDIGVESAVVDGTSVDKKSKKKREKSEEEAKSPKKQKLEKSQTDDTRASKKNVTKTEESQGTPESPKEAAKPEVKSEPVSEVPKKKKEKKQKKAATVEADTSEPSESPKKAKKSKKKAVE